MNPSYECPKCGEWIEVFRTPTAMREGFSAVECADHIIKCDSCGEQLRLDVDAEFANGSWRDLSKLVTAGSHWDDKV